MQRLFTQIERAERIGRPQADAGGHERSRIPCRPAPARSRCAM